MRRRAGVLWCVALGILQTTIVSTLAVVDPPFNLMIVNVTQNTLQYSWEVANTSCNGSSIDGYTRSLDEQSPVATSSDDTAEDSITGLQPNTSHSVRVRVVCNDGRMSNFSTPLPFTTENFVCSLVCENSGVLNSTSCSCDCMEPYTGPTCGNCSLECLNGGSRNAGECTCSCVNHFEGIDCSECPLNLVCQNSGTVNRDTCSCSCTGGFSGDSCEVCSLVCENSGVLNSTSCSCDCMEPYTGPTCGNCSLECLNGGSRNAGGCTCSCVNHFEGIDCSECPLDLVCQNNGTVNRDTCSCSCTGGFSGDNCEECSLSCMNGGTFNDSLCLCTCTDGYIGQNCETLDLSINLTTAEYVGIGIAAGVILLLCCIGFVWAIVSDYCVLSTKWRRSRYTDP